MNRCRYGRLVVCPLWTGCLLLVSLLAACAPHFSAVQSAATSSVLEEDYWRSTDGYEHVLQRWLPVATPQAILVAVHGFNDYANFIRDAASYWVREGVAVFSYDQRGFGRSQRSGLWPGRRVLADDLEAFTELLSKRYPGIPIYVLGESMGGAVAVLAFAGEPNGTVEGIILAAPAVWSRSTMPWYQRTLLELAARLLPSWKVTGEGLQIRPSDNRDMLLALSRDPWVIKETRLDTLYGLSNLMDEAYGRVPELNTPLLVLYGAQDQVIPRRPVLEFVQQLPGRASRQQRFAWYENGYHMLLRDLQAPVVWRDVLVWMQGQGDRLPSGADVRAHKIVTIAEQGLDG